MICIKHSPSLQRAHKSDEGNSSVCWAGIFRKPHRAMHRKERMASAILWWKNVCFLLGFWWFIMKPYYYLQRPLGWVHGYQSGNHCSFYWWGNWYQEKGCDLSSITLWNSSEPVYDLWLPDSRTAFLLLYFHSFSLKRKPFLPLYLQSSAKDSRGLLKISTDSVLI